MNKRQGLQQYSPQTCWNWLKWLIIYNVIDWKIGYSRGCITSEQIHLTSAKTPGNHDTFSTDYCTL